MRNYDRRILAGMVTLLLAACSTESDVSEKSSGKLHACEIVAGSEVSRIAGAEVVASNVDVEYSAGKEAFSQCTHTLEGPRPRVTVQLRTFESSKTMSRQVDADKERTSDDGSGYGIKFAEAIEAGIDIGGVGDTAYIFEMFGTQYLVAYKNARAEVRVWTPIGKDGKERAVEIGKAVATEALRQL